MKEMRQVFLQNQEETVLDPFQTMLQCEPKLPRRVQQPWTVAPSFPESNQKSQPPPYMALRQSS